MWGGLWAPERSYASGQYSERGRRGRGEIVAGLNLAIFLITVLWTVVYFCYLGCVRLWKRRLARKATALENAQSDSGAVKHYLRALRIPALPVAYQADVLQDKLCVAALHSLYEKCSLPADMTRVQDLYNALEELFAKWKQIDASTPRLLRGTKAYRQSTAPLLGTYRFLRGQLKAALGELPIPGTRVRSLSSLRASRARIIGAVLLAGGGILLWRGGTPPLDTDRVRPELLTWPMAETVPLSDGLIAYQAEPIQVQVLFDKAVSTVNSYWCGKSARLTVAGTNVAWEGIPERVDCHWGTTMITGVSASGEVRSVDRIEAATPGNVSPAFRAELNLPPPSDRGTLAVVAEMEATYPTPAQSWQSNAYIDKTSLLKRSYNLVVISAEELQQRGLWLHWEARRGFYPMAGFLLCGIAFVLIIRSLPRQSLAPKRR